MISVRGIFRNGTIQLLPSSDLIPTSGEIILTIVQPESTGTAASGSHMPTSPVTAPENEAQFERLRKHKRVRAHGKIKIIHGLERDTYSLFDYSQGGLSFLTKHPFEIGQKISAAVSDPSDTDLILMELAMEVRGVFRSDKPEFSKIGCMFLDGMDEELWHGVLQFIS